MCRSSRNGGLGMFHATFPKNFAGWTSEHAPPAILICGAGCKFSWTILKPHQNGGMQLKRSLVWWIGRGVGIGQAKMIKHADFAVLNDGDLIKQETKHWPTETGHHQGKPFFNRAAHGYLQRPAPSPVVCRWPRFSSNFAGEIRWHQQEFSWIFHQTCWWESWFFPTFPHIFPWLSKVAQDKWWNWQLTNKKQVTKSKICCEKPDSEQSSLPWFSMISHVFPTFFCSDFGPRISVSWLLAGGATALTTGPTTLDVQVWSTSVFHIHGMIDDYRIIMGLYI